MEPHPLGVLPLGNCYASGGGAAVAAAVAAGRSSDAVRTEGLGALAPLPDELLLTLLGALPPAALAALCTASRACYAFCCHEDLWRAHTLRAFGGDIRFTRTWRDTYRRVLVCARVSTWHVVADGTLTRRRRLARRRRVTGTEPAPDAPDEVAPAVERVRAPGLCSDVLFQSHLCAATPMRPRWLERHTVPRAAGLTRAQFLERYEMCVALASCVRLRG